MTVQRFPGLQLKIYMMMVIQTCDSTNILMFVMLFTLKPCIFPQSTNPELDFSLRWTCV